jgi:hypothetical protein
MWAQVVLKLHVTYGERTRTFSKELVTVLPFLFSQVHLTQQQHSSIGYHTLQLSASASLPGCVLPCPCTPHSIQQLTQVCTVPCTTNPFS